MDGRCVRGTFPFRYAQIGLHLPSGIYVFTFAYGISFGPIGWVLPSEVFPVSVRSKGVALSTASNWINNCKL